MKLVIAHTYTLCLLNNVCRTRWSDFFVVDHTITKQYIYIHVCVFDGFPLTRFQ